MSSTPISASRFHLHRVVHSPSLHQKQSGHRQTPSRLLRGAETGRLAVMLTQHVRRLCPHCASISSQTGAPNSPSPPILHTASPRYGQVANWVGTRLLQHAGGGSGRPGHRMGMGLAVERLVKHAVGAGEESNLISLGLLQACWLCGAG